MTPKEQGESAAKRLAAKVKAAKMAKVINPKTPANGDGTTFAENMKNPHGKPQYKGKHRGE